MEKLIVGIIHAETLSSGTLPRDGFVTVTARANLLLQGELFANYPASGTAILAYQGTGMFYAMVNETGHFTIKGVADKKNVLDKLIIEGYRFDEKTGKVVWAIDKKETGKDNYRLKLLRKSMQTDLVLFNCRETTLFNLLEPRSFAYMTKMQLFDGRRDAPPEDLHLSIRLIKGQALGGDPFPVLCGPDASSFSHLFLPFPSFLIFSGGGICFFSRRTREMSFCLRVVCPLAISDLKLNIRHRLLNAIHSYTSILFIRRLAVNDQKHFHVPHLLIHVRPIVRRRRERLPFFPLRRHFSSSGAV